MKQSIHIGIRWTQEEDSPRRKTGGGLKHAFTGWHPLRTGDSPRRKTGGGLKHMIDRKLNAVISIPPVERRGAD